MRLIDADRLIEYWKPDHDRTFTADYFIHTIEAQPTVNQWIPVSKRLPEESGLYQVTDMQGNVVRYVFNVSESSKEYWRRCVKAWMPLPSPYKEDT